MTERIAVADFNEVQSQLYAALRRKGFDCEKIDLTQSKRIREYIKNFSIVILPFPSTADKLGLDEEESICEVFSKNQLIVGSLFDEKLKSEFTENGIKFVDYFDYEPYVLKNAYLTSQGVLRLLFEKTKCFLPGKNVLITGFGRIGKSLAGYLKALGMRVYIGVRSDAQANEAACCGYEVLKLSEIKGALFYFDFIFNTVPHRIFSQKDIGRIREKTLYFEIASNPFGVDRNDFITNGRQFVDASALPGKFYPEAVAENIFNIILKNSELMKGVKL